MRRPSEILDANVRKNAKPHFHTNMAERETARTTVDCQIAAL